MLNSQDIDEAVRRAVTAVREGIIFSALKV